MKKTNRNTSSKNITKKALKTVKHRNKSENQYVEIYPMMPRRYTYVQRAELRKFERELLEGLKMNIG